MMANTRKTGGKRGKEPSRGVEPELAVRSPRLDSIVHVLIDALPPSEQSRHRDSRELLVDSLNRAAFIATVAARKAKDSGTFRRVATVLVAVGAALRRDPELIRPLYARASDILAKVVDVQIASELGAHIRPAGSKRKRR